MSRLQKRFSNRFVNNNIIKASNFEKYKLGNELYSFPNAIGGQQWKGVFGIVRSRHS